MSIKTYFNSPKSSWLRWLGLLPIAVIAYLIVSPLVKTIGDLIQMWNEIDNMDRPTRFGDLITRYIVTFVAGVLSSEIFIYVGVFIAPKFKKQTAFVFMILMLLIAVVGIYLGYLGYDPNPRQYSAMAENIGILLGAIHGYSIFSKHRQIQNKLYE